MRIHLVFEFDGNGKGLTLLGDEPKPVPAPPPVPSRVRVKRDAYPGIKQVPIGDLRAEARSLGIDVSKLGRHKVIMRALIDKARAEAQVGKAKATAEARKKPAPPPPPRAPTLTPETLMQMPLEQIFRTLMAQGAVVQV